MDQPWGLALGTVDLYCAQEQVPPPLHSTVGLCSHCP